MDITKSSAYNLTVATVGTGYWFIVNPILYLIFPSNLATNIFTVISSPLVLWIDYSVLNTIAEPYEKERIREFIRCIVSGISYLYEHVF